MLCFTPVIPIKEWGQQARGQNWDKSVCKYLQILLQCESEIGICSLSWSRWPLLRQAKGWMHCICIVSFSYFFCISLVFALYLNHNCNVFALDLSEIWICSLLSVSGLSYAWKGVTDCLQVPVKKAHSKLKFTMEVDKDWRKKLPGWNIMKISPKPSWQGYSPPSPIWTSFFYGGLPLTISWHWGWSPLPFVQAGATYYEEQLK